MANGSVVFDARIRTPFTLICAGQTASGKTTFVINLLLNAEYLLDSSPDYYVWFYGIESNATEFLRENEVFENLTLHKGLPESFDDFIQPGKKGCFVIDDLTRESSNSPLVAELFFQKSHHNFVSVILLTQNLFFEGKERKNLLRNAHNLCIFSNPLDQSIVYTLANKILPSNQKTFFDIFDAALSEDFGYLLVIGQLRVPRISRFRTDIFGLTQRVFTPTAWLKKN